MEVQYSYENKNLFLTYLFKTLIKIVIAFVWYHIVKRKKIIQCLYSKDISMQGKKNKKRKLMAI